MSEAGDTATAAAQKTKQAKEVKGKAVATAAGKAAKDGEGHAAGAEGAVDEHGGDLKTPRIVEDSKLPNATQSPPPGEVITSRLPPEQLSLLLQVRAQLV